MDVSRITHLEIDGQDVTDYIRVEPEPWTLDHRLHVFNQIESRPGQPNEKGEQWMERRLTGLVLAVCNCGFNTGWIPRDQLPSSGELLGRHGVAT